MQRNSWPAVCVSPKVLPLPLSLVGATVRIVLNTEGSSTGLAGFVEGVPPDPIQTLHRRGTEDDWKRRGLERRKRTKRRVGGNEDREKRWKSGAEGGQLLGRSKRGSAFETK